MQQAKHKPEATWTNNIQIIKEELVTLYALVAGNTQSQILLHGRNSDFPLSQLLLCSFI